MVKVKRPAPPNRLKVLRAMHNRTQFDVAHYLGISQTRYWQIENSHLNADAKEREKIARFFGVEASEAFPASTEAA